MNRTCKICGLVQKINQFPKAGLINNKQYYRAKCHTCYHIVKKTRRGHLKNWLREYKKTLSCSRCGNDDYRVLEFHHLYDKEENVANMISHGYSTLNIKREIDKCDVLCANCHRIITWENRA